MKNFKRSGFYFFVEPFEWLFYCFTAPVRLENILLYREHSISKIRRISMSRLLFSIFLLSYIFSFCIYIIIFIFKWVRVGHPDPDFTNGFFFTALGVLCGGIVGIVWNLQQGIESTLFSSLWISVVVAVIWNFGSDLGASALAAILIGATLNRFGRSDPIRVFTVCLWNVIFVLILGALSSIVLGGLWNFWGTNWLGWVEEIMKLGIANLLRTLNININQGLYQGVVLGIALILPIGLCSLALGLLIQIILQSRQERLDSITFFVMWFIRIIIIGGVAAELVVIILLSPVRLPLSEIATLLYSILQTGHAITQDELLTLLTGIVIGCGSGLIIIIRSAFKPGRKSIGGFFEQKLGKEIIWGLVLAIAQGLVIGILAGGFTNKIWWGLVEGALLVTSYHINHHQVFARAITFFSLRWAYASYREQPSRVFFLLNNSALYWDKIFWLPNLVIEKPELIKMLRAAAMLSPDQTMNEISHITRVFPEQEWGELQAIAAELIIHLPVDQALEEIAFIFAEQQNLIYAAQSALEQIARDAIRLIAQMQSIDQALQALRKIAFILNGQPYLITEARNALEKVFIRELEFIPRIQDGDQALMTMARIVALQPRSLEEMVPLVAKQPAPEEIAFILTKQPQSVETSWPINNYGLNSRISIPDISLEKAVQKAATQIVKRALEVIVVMQNMDQALEKIAVILYRETQPLGTFAHLRSEPPRALQEMAFLVASQSQLQIDTRTAVKTIIFRKFAMHRSVREIAENYQYFQQMFAHAEKLLDPDLIPLFSDLLNACSNMVDYYHLWLVPTKLRALTEMEDKLKGFQADTQYKQLGFVVSIWLNAIGNEKDQIFNIIANPYLAGPDLPLGNSLFVGRHKLITQLQEALKQGSQRPTFFLNGERRMGKTSTLNQLPNLLDDPSFIPISYNLQAPHISSSIVGFFDKVADEIANILQSRKKVQVEILTKRILQEAYRQNEAEVYVIFNEWLEKVERLLEEKNWTLLLSFDEFEKLEETEDINIHLLLNWFRSVIQNRPRLALLFSGGKSIAEMGKNWAGYLINVQTLRVSFLQPEEARQLITQPLPTPDIFNNDVVTEIMHVTGCHPFLIQAVCSALITNLDVEGRDKAEVSDVAKAIEQVFESWSDTYFQDLWDRTNPEQRVCLFAIRKLEEGTLQHISEQSNISENIVRRTLQTLLKRDLILEKNGKYRIATPIFAEWVELNS